MRRPLAATGSCVFLCLLASVSLPANRLFLLCIVFLVFGIVSLGFCREGSRRYIPLLMLACGLSLLYKFSYDAVVRAPLQILEGQSAVVQAVVEKVQSGYNAEVFLLQLKIEQVEGYENLPSFRVKVNSLPHSEVGELVELRLEFENRASYDGIENQYADGIFLEANAQSDLRHLGKETSVYAFLSALREEAASNIFQRLPPRLASVLSAISLGETRFLEIPTKQAYRMAGLSHVLVVSGMHLSLVCFALRSLVLFLTKSKTQSAVCSILGVVVFVMFTGFTPSMMRSGLACLLAFTAPFFSRKADAFTSLGFAALFLCALNPYAALDIGLQFSLTATLGVLLGGGCVHRWRRLWQLPLQSKAKRVGFSLLSAIFLPLCATAATLPVVIFNQLSFSLLSVFSNVLVMPLLVPLVLGGFFLALPFGFAPLDFLLRPLALFEGILLVFLEKITTFCASLPWLYPSIGGLFPFVSVLLVYALIACAVRGHHRKLYTTAAAAVFFGSLLFSQWMANDVVTVSVAGTGPQASLVASENGQATVIYRGRNSLDEIEDVLEREGVREIVLWVDLRKTAQSSEAERLYQPETLYIVSQELFYQESFLVSDELRVDILRQEDGFIACIDIDGYKIALTNGTLNVLTYPAIDILLPSNAAVQGEFGFVVSSGEVPDWVPEDQTLLQNGGSATFMIRPRTSVVYKEASRDLFFSEMG